MAQTQKVKAVGSRREVMSGSARHTAGNLKKKDLMMHKGRIVSRKAHAAGKKAIKRLFSLGYKPQKGKFVAMRKSMVNGRKRRQTRKRGGSNGVPRPEMFVGSGSEGSASAAALKDGFASLLKM